MALGESFGQENSHEREIHFGGSAGKLCLCESRRAREDMKEDARSKLKKKEEKEEEKCKGLFRS